MADVVEIARRTPKRGAAPRRVGRDAPAADVAPAPAPARADGGLLSVDGWGRDDALIRALGPLARLRWDVSVGGEQHIPAAGGALLVATARTRSLSSLFAAWALTQATGRPVRFVGRPEVAPLGPFMRRLGGLLAAPDEVAGAIRDGEVVLITTAATNHPRLAGSVDHHLLAGAVLAKLPVIPVATMSTPIGRGARVEVGPPVESPRRRRGPLAEVELAAAVQQRLQKMLDELGGLRTGFGPIDWLGET